MRFDRLYAHRTTDFHERAHECGGSMLLGACEYDDPIFERNGGVEVGAFEVVGPVGLLI